MKLGIFGGKWWWEEYKDLHKFGCTVLWRNLILDSFIVNFHKEVLFS